MNLRIAAALMSAVAAFTVTPPVSAFSSLSSELSSFAPDEVITGDDMLVDNIRDHSPQGSYNRDFFGGWLSVNNPNAVGWGTDPAHDGCNVREAMLIDYALEVTVLPGCNVVDGIWEDVYTAGSQLGRDRSDYHVDHVVPLAQAWRSGADRYDDDTLKQIANDKDNLILTSAYTNLAKGDSAIDTWFPENGSESYCEYAEKYATVVNRYDLAITQAEYDQINKMYGECGMTL